MIQNSGYNVCVFSFYSDVYKIQEGIGDKIGLLLQAFSTFVASFVIGFVKGWKMTLVILAVSPVLGVAAGLFGKVSFFPFCSFNNLFAFVFK